MQQPQFYSLNADEQTALAAIVALLLADGLNADQLNILGNFVEAVGQNLLLIQAVVSSSPAAADSGAAGDKPQQELADTLAVLQAEIDRMKTKIAELETKCLSR